VSASELSHVQKSSLTFDLPYLYFRQSETFIQPSSTEKVRLPFNRSQNSFRTDLFLCLRAVEIVQGLLEQTLAHEGELLIAVEASAELDWCVFLVLPSSLRLACPAEMCGRLNWHSLIAFAGAALDWNWRRPEMTEENVLVIKKGRCVRTLFLCERSRSENPHPFYLVTRHPLLVRSLVSSVQFQFRDSLGVSKSTGSRPRSLRPQLNTTSRRARSDRRTGR
jgi:hypothetical protein